MDGLRSTDEIWHSLLNQLREHTPTQDETIELLCQLSDNDLLQCEITPNVAELFRRRFEKNRKRRLAMLNPLAFKVPLFDPDKLLERLLPLARVLFHPASLVVWAVVVLLGLLSAGVHWRDIGAYASLHTATPKFLLLLWLCYPFIKAIHELGHGLAVKAWGGEVRETGISLLLLVPVPFVDASSASSFPEKHRRAVVGAAGIMVELFLAAGALFAWINVEDGLVREIAFVVMTVGGVSTVLFNGNPLLRFDGYYVLSDLLDVPNLAHARERLRRLPRATPPAEGGRRGLAGHRQGRAAAAARLRGACLLLPLVRVRPHRLLVRQLLVLAGGAGRRAGAVEHGGEAARGRCLRQRPRAASPPCSSAKPAASTPSQNE